MDISLILKGLKSIGFGTGARASRYSIYRDWANHLPYRPPKPPNDKKPGKLLSVHILANGAHIDYEDADLTIEFLTSILVRISWGPGTLPIPYTISRKEWEPVHIDIERSGDSLSIMSDRLLLRVSENGTITYYNPDGIILRRDLSPEILKGGWRTTAQLRSDEHLYGLGERTMSLNLFGKSVRSWNSDPGGSYSSGKDPIYICTPVFIALGSTGSYMMYFENSFPGIFNFQSLSTIELSGGALRYYFIYGTLQESFDQYSQLTGRPPLPPRWVFGYHQSRWGYKSDAEIREVVDRFETNQFPLSAIHLDIDYMDGYRVFTIDQARFPNLSQLSNDLAAKGVKLVTIIDPGVKKDTSYSVYRNGKSENVFCKTPNNKVMHGVVWPGWSAYPDFTDPKTRRWWGDLYKTFIDNGVSGFWHDMNEPVSFAAWGDTTLPGRIKHDFEGRKGNHLEAHNLYGFLMNKAGFEGLQRIRPEQRPWIISRSGWAGLQKYAWNWTGDVASTWEAYRQTLITILGLSLSGHIFSGSDIGGFSGNPSPELYVRWFQFASFCPFFRTHSAINTERREPWLYGEPYTSIIREYLLLRYKLIPYFYTNAWLANQNGLPIIRPMFWNNPEQSHLWDIDDQFYFGDDIIIAPILASKNTSRNVTIPFGEWYLYWDDTKYSGICTKTIDAPLEQIPILVRAGSILPMEVNGNLELHVYLSSEGSSRGMLFSDAGDGYGDWREDKFSCKRDGDTLHMIRFTNGDFPYPYKSTSITLHGAFIKTSLVDGTEIIPFGNRISVGEFSAIAIELTKM